MITLLDPRRIAAGVRNRHLLLTDVLGLITALFLAFSARFESFAWGPQYGRFFVVFLAATLPFKLLFFWVGGLYRRLWRHAGITELETILIAVSVSAGLGLVVGAWLLPILDALPSRVPLAVLALDALLTGVVAAGPRLTLRAIGPPVGGADAPAERRVLIVGAGEAGGLMARDLRANPSLALTPVGFLDDDLDKQGQMLRGLPVLGTLADLSAVAARVAADEVIIAMPAAPGTAVRRVLTQARVAGLGLRTMPSVFEVMHGQQGLAMLRSVQIEDLLRREPVQLDLGRIDATLGGEVVVVTGAGGSIGSELSRQVAACRPRTLVLLDHGENSVFAIHRELHEHHPRLDLRPVIVDVRDERRLHQTLAPLAPGVIFHAAAHKHVPLMETNVPEAITNNVLGTRNVAELAVRAGVDRMVLISTDKAVRPTNVMGVTKRIAEQLLQELAEAHQRNFISVRFGNVLGSSASVVPLFRQQIERGGPVTVTNPEMRRYFMTIPESVHLVQQAAVLGSGGEVFVLDMGAPVRILDLATQLIQLSGLEVGRDIEIEFTGVRPGEKLHEELFFGREAATPTEHPRVLCAKPVPLPIGLSTVVEQLIDAAGRGVDDDDLRRLLVQLVPEYHPERSAHSISSVRNEDLCRAAVGAKP